MTAIPPRPKRREPFLLSADYEPEVTVEEPIPLTSADVPTMRDLSEQIGAVGSHLQVVHEEAALARVAANDAAAEARAARGEIAEVRRLVVGDHAPRITQVEAKTSRITLPPSAKAGGIGVGAGGAVVLAAEVLWPLVQRWLETR